MKFKTIHITELFWLLSAVIMMGFCLSFLDLTALGTDPCTTCNLGISQKLGLSLGNWQAFFNCVLFILVFFLAKDQIGWGTLANMFLVGYSFDFFSWINNRLFPADFFEPMYVRILVAIPALALFVLAASVYMAIQQGTAPYDAMSYILYRKIAKVPFKIVRMCWDLLFCMLGLLLGEKPGIITFLMAFTLGPVITYAEKHIVSKLIRKKP